MPNYSRYQRRQPSKFAQPTRTDVRAVDPLLTDLSIGFKNERFLWEQLAPPFRTPDATGQFPVYTRDFWLRRQGGAERAAEGPYQKVGWGVTFSTFTTVEIGFEKSTGDVIKAASQLSESLEVTDTAFLTELIQIEMEKRVSAAGFVTGAWGTSNTLTGTDQWSDFANSDPIADADTAMRTIRRNTGTAPNMLIVGLLGWEKLKEHPLILDKYKHTQVGIMTEDLVAAVLGMDSVVVGDSVENTGDEGTAFTGADIWTDNALFLKNDTPGAMTATSAVSFIWDEKGNFPWAVETYRDEAVRSDVTRIFTHQDVQITSSQHGYLFLDVVA